MPRFVNTVALMDACKRKNNWPSDYRLMKQLGFSQQAVSAWRSGRAQASDAALVKFADCLELPRQYVLVAAAIWRTDCPEAKRTWRELLRCIERTQGIEKLDDYHPSDVARNMLTGARET